MTGDRAPDGLVTDDPTADRQAKHGSDSRAHHVSRAGPPRWVARASIYSSAIGVGPIDKHDTAVAPCPGLETT